MKKTKPIVADVEDCPRCKQRKFETRLHDFTSVKVQRKLSRQPFHFSEWKYCTNCGFIFVEEKFKVFTNGSALTRQSQFNKMLMEDHQNKLDFFRRAHGI